ncbi:MAG: hypothetical protein UY41_C0027G0012 [Candidatus Moranbacteria bacterium GW2011_GWE1_49_15]|nr:MAG: hypothetical protein UY41_C0027G0012 [Candidatus Moranbacteria bacterium GW2011_GWE1_49_15]HBP00627.1 hypothetical protein [Candidatus Moranbacteria bacterium]
MKAMALVGLAAVLLLCGFTPVGNTDPLKSLKKHAIKTGEALDMAGFTFPRVFDYVGGAMDK